MTTVDDSSNIGKDASKLMVVSQEKDDSSASSLSIILFYKYHPLSDKSSVVELYRLALEKFCVSLCLRGRILVGCSEHRSEGINGTLSGTKTNLEIFVRAFANEYNKNADEASNTFRNDCEAFYEAAHCQPLEMDESEFKWSELKGNNNNSKSSDATACEEQFFPDLNIKIVNELIGTGGVLSSIKIDECHKGYLTPREWHERIAQLQAKKASDADEADDTILIDCRNTKECAIGNFVGSVDPQTTTFNQFPKWVDDHKHKLRNKNVLMYCTGGIRCEKASAYVRHAMGSSVKEVRHLKGGIHKYLESYGDSKAAAAIDPLWRGKNFVFDGRGAHGPEDSSVEVSKDTPVAAATKASGTAVGVCRYCEAPYDSFDPHCVCTVCKEPILVCKLCQAFPSQTNREDSTSSTNKTDQSNRPQHLREYHCSTHKHLEGCYFTNLEMFLPEELSKQLFELEILQKEIAVGKKFRQRRKTLAKQCGKIEARLEELGGCIDTTNGNNATREGIELKCRNCGQIGCSGKCWGFHGLKRKRVLEKNEGQQQRLLEKEHRKEFVKNHQNKRLKQQKELQKQKQIDEWIASGLTLGPESGRDPSTGLRVPKPCMRILESTTKGKWCGSSLLKVLKTEFPNSFRSRAPQQQDSTPQSTESETENTLRTLLQKGLIRVNGTPIKSLDEANDYKLKNMDVIDRIVLWHEPPIHLPSETILVQKIPIPESFLPAGKNKEDSIAVSDNHIYVCDKPSSVPVHPAGPYLSNSLTMLVEAQEGLRPKTLIPCHRIDRVTSGMTICCAHSRVAKLIQTTMAQKSNNTGNGTGMSKQYLACVMGRFPLKKNNDTTNCLPSLSNDAIAKWDWIANYPNDSSTPNESVLKQSAMFLQVDAPIETVDPLNGIRKITSRGKASRSLFRSLEYDAQSDSSIILCVPVTGRSHQLRVHLEWLGHSIVNDIQYGGVSKTTIDPAAGVQRMIDNVRDYNSSEKYANHAFVTDELAQAARDVCPTCDLDTNGQSSAFSPAQLLQGGHAICLHAYRYTFSFPSIATKQDSSEIKQYSGDAKNEDEPSVFKVDLKVNLPPWASHLDDGFDVL